MDIEVVYFNELNADKIYNGAEPYSDDGIEKFKKYIKEQNAVYYGRYNEEFYIEEAIALARKANVKKVIVENLS
jgi:hypothetical protein